MKKTIIAIISTMTIIFTLSNVYASSFVNEEIDDMTTKNIKEKIDFNYKEIKELCSYEKCINVDTDSMDAVIESFIRGYSIGLDEETKAILNIKGIKITKIILKN